MQFWPMSRFNLGPTGRGGQFRQKTVGNYPIAHPVNLLFTSLACHLKEIYHAFIMFIFKESKSYPSPTFSFTASWASDLSLHYSS